MSNPDRPFDLRVAWRRHDPAMERDAERFWMTHKVLPRDADVPARLGELCIVAYDGERLVAVSTAGLREVAFLGSRLSIFRCAIAPESRGKRLSYAIMARARQVIEEWSAAHREERVMGMATIAQTKEAFLGDGPGIFKGSGLAFVGWTANGERMRVAWFEHSTIPRFPPGSDRQA